MKIDILGGGPAGLFSAILIKKSQPGATIRVYEQNRPDDTFGFGIVLSDETLNNIRTADEDSYRAIAAEYAYWDDIYVHYKGTVERSGGHGFSGLQRLAMLRILQRRAAALGVDIAFQTRAPAIDQAARNADLVIACDGINSPAREAWKAHFRPLTDLRPNKFVWLGADWKLPGLKSSAVAPSGAASGLLVPALAVGIALCGAVPARAQAPQAPGNPSAELLTELKTRLTESPKCAPDCSEVASARVAVDGDRLEVTLQVSLPTCHCVPMLADLPLTKRRIHQMGPAPQPADLLLETDVGSSLRH